MVFDTFNGHVAAAGCLFDSASLQLWIDPLPALPEGREQNLCHRKKRTPPSIRVAELFVSMYKRLFLI